MSTPPEQPGGPDTPEAPKLIEEQLDDLLSKIESAEPGTLDPDVLPKSAEAASPAPQASADTEIQAMLDAPPTQAEINALLDSPPAETTADEPANPGPPPEEPMPTEQAEMLSAMNTALQGLPEDPPADESTSASAEPEPAEASGEELSIEEQLQQEIAALMEAEDDGQSPPDPVDQPSTEDQIAMEIEGLLTTEEAPAAAATAEPAEAAIEELDQMLAQEIDEDDELAGDFHSVEDVTAGIQVEDPSELAVDDEHAATARDVAAELDSQPEDMPAEPEPGPIAEPVAAIAEAPAAEAENESPENQLFDDKPTDWRGRLELGKEKLLSTCYLINWPARRFLSAEWRANLGYIALLNLFFGVGLWIVLILF